MDTAIKCPKCAADKVIKSGIVQDRQRHKCKSCGYFFTVDKLGKRIDNYYVTKSIQLYYEGLSYRDIERLLGVSHVSVMNWVKQYGVVRPDILQRNPEVELLSHEELMKYMEAKDNLKDMGYVLSEVGDKFLLIKWNKQKPK
ncbi:MAG: hypothetical protein V4620_12120 [Bacteroidota bacterium]